MSPYEADALSRTIVEGRVRDANRRRLVRELKRGAQRPTPAAAVPEPQRESYVWRLLHHHHRHAYS